MEESDASLKTVEDSAANVQINAQISMIVARAIGKDWKFLGRVMEIEEEKLDAIENDNRSQGIEEMAYKMLIFWKGKLSYGATVPSLAEHLKSVNRADIADKILQMTFGPEAVSKMAAVSLCEAVEKPKHQPPIPMSGSIGYIKLADSAKIQGSIVVGGVHGQMNVGTRHLANSIDEYQ